MLDLLGSVDRFLPGEDGSVETAPAHASVGAERR
jgi:hypothetical protein